LLLTESDTFLLCLSRKAQLASLASPVEKAASEKRPSRLILALALSAKGLRVGLLDADLGLANSQILLGVNAPTNVSHVFDGEKTVTDVAVETPQGLLLIPRSIGQSGAGQHYGGTSYLVN
jgi:Mrp family chromosome partitioning ATPase